MVQGTPKLLGRRKTVGLPAEAPAARFDADVTLAAVAREWLLPLHPHRRAPRGLRRHLTEALDVAVILRQHLSGPDSSRDGGAAVVLGEAGDQTDQESRSAAHRAAASISADRPARADVKDWVVEPETEQGAS